MIRHCYHWLATPKSARSDEIRAEEMLPSSAPILRHTTCPHCWTRFDSEDILWIAAHNDLLGDARLGPEAHQRFLPTRFDIEGNALDARGFTCRELACPHCHLAIPRIVVETEPLFVSILGVPACGKSYFLTSMTWELRRILPERFALSYADADPHSNRMLNEFEEDVFLSDRADEWVPLGDLIRKTELEGASYDIVSFGSHGVRYPRPFLFALQSLAGHPRSTDGRKLSRLLCMYDNAGEHFLAGQDSPSNPVTQHLARSRMLLFLFDPTQDPRVPKGEPSDDPAGGRTARQETVLHEAALRVRRHMGLRHDETHSQPLIVVVTKMDQWRTHLGHADFAEPWIDKNGLAGLDIDWVEGMSRRLRDLLNRFCPEVVAAAENFTQNVVYIPVSALGVAPRREAEVKRSTVRPREIRPHWVAVPLLSGLARWVPGISPAARRRDGGPHEAKINTLPDH
jgi:hypothetical protein